MGKGIVPCLDKELIHYSSDQNNRPCKALETSLAALESPSLGGCKSHSRIAQHVWGRLPSNINGLLGGLLAKSSSLIQSYKRPICWDRTPFSSASVRGKCKGSHHRLERGCQSSSSSSKDMGRLDLAWLPEAGLPFMFLGGSLSSRRSSRRLNLCWC